MDANEKPNHENIKEESSPDSVAMLGEVLLESLKEQEQNDLEVFELYTHVLRSKIHFRSQDFCERFTKGYQILLEELSKS